MKYDYDSPLMTILEPITTAVAINTDDAVVKAVGKLGIDVDKEKLIQALKADKARYNEAYRKGYAAAKAHGYWVPCGFNNENISCSNCGAWWYEINREASFCPNCGSMMDLKYGGLDSDREQ